MDNTKTYCTGCAFLTKKESAEALFNFPDNIKFEGDTKHFRYMGYNQPVCLKDHRLKVDFEHTFRNKKKVRVLECKDPEAFNAKNDCPHYEKRKVHNIIFNKLIECINAFINFWTC